MSRRTFALMGLAVMAGLTFGYYLAEGLMYVATN